MLIGVIGANLGVGNRVGENVPGPKVAGDTVGINGAGDVVRFGVAGEGLGAKVVLLFGGRDGGMTWGGCLGGGGALFGDGFCGGGLGADGGRGLAGGRGCRGFGSGGRGFGSGGRGFGSGGRGAGGVENGGPFFSPRVAFLSRMSALSSPSSAAVAMVLSLDRSSSLLLLPEKPFGTLKFLLKSIFLSSAASVNGLGGGE